MLRQNNFSFSTNFLTKQNNINLFANNQKTIIIILEAIENLNKQRHQEILLDKLIILYA